MNRFAGRRVPISPPRIPTSDSRRVIPAPPVKPPKDHYATPEHRAWALAVKRRAGFCCEKCGEPARPLYADHIIELQDGGDPLALSNGQCLCSSCHLRKTHREKMARLLRP
jgi:5-methylcytosine-specific restriction protein A